jgi:hypothetical protein
VNTIGAIGDAVAPIASVGGSVHPVGKRGMQDVIASQMFSCFVGAIVGSCVGGCVGVLIELRQHL